MCHSFTNIVLNKSYIIISQKIGAEDDESTAHATKLLSADEKQKILKERRKAKRKNKEASKSADATLESLAADEV